MEGKEEVGEGRRGAARQPVKKSNHEQSEFLGRKFGQIGKKNQAFYSPENLY
jgi:hypothetical protein